MERSTFGSRRTFIFDFLPPDERASLVAECTTVQLVYGDVLYEPPSRVNHVYFPTTGFVSLVKTASNGSSIEVGMIGHEGLFGNELNTLDGLATITALVQGAGGAMRMGLATFRQQLGRSSAMRELVQQHSSYRLRQMAQTIVCTRFHVIEERLARWLLMTSDRAGSATFAVTHEFLSYMLGARRSGVTSAMGVLRDRGLIAYRRSEVQIVDLSGLVDAACSCIEVDLEAYRHEMLPRQASN